MFWIGRNMLRDHPDLVNLPDESETQQLFQRLAADAFWEHAETAFIRLCSYWDRVGQILDFAFFRIRHFERDGFAAVMDRLHANVIPVNPLLGKSTAWRELRGFQSSGREDGLKWLQRRRNILVHSLHLRPLDSESKEEVFRSGYNHLEEKLRSKLAPREPEVEIWQLPTHLDRAAHLFPAVLSILEESEDRSG